MMTKFKKKPIIVEAEQWFPGVLIREVFQQKTVSGVKAHIITPRGKFPVLPGDWIVIGIDRQIYPVSDSNFKKTYEPVAE